jgi:rubrerythrin
MTPEATNHNADMPQLFGCRACGTYLRSSAPPPPKCPQCGRKGTFVPIENAGHASADRAK